MPSLNRPEYSDYEIIKYLLLKKIRQIQEDSFFDLAFSGGAGGGATNPPPTTDDKKNEDTEENKENKEEEKEDEKDKDKDENADEDKKDENENENDEDEDKSDDDTSGGLYSDDDDKSDESETSDNDNQTFSLEYKLQLKILFNSFVNIYKLVEDLYVLNKKMFYVIYLKYNRLFEYLKTYINNFDALSDEKKTKLLKLFRKAFLKLNQELADLLNSN